MPRHHLAFASLLALTCSGPTPPVDSAPRGRIEFNDSSWELSGDATIETTASGTELQLTTGKAVQPEVEFRDGTIEFDLELTPYRSFVFVEFRIQDEGEHEEIYFRPHKSLLPDAFQYTPVYNGRGQWQLYHDGWSTAAAPLPPGQPIHVRLVVKSQMGTVYVGDMERPRSLFLLARPAAAGHIALRSFLPAGAPEVLPPKGTPVARFSNVSIRPGEVDRSLFPNFETFIPPEGRVSAWLVSPAFAPPEGPVRELPLEVLRSTDWKRVPTTLIGGFIEIERHVTRPEGARRAAVLARLEITAEDAGTRRLDLGFSDEVSVFLNGRLIASANGDYSFAEPRREGLLHLDQLAVYLPFRKGENELTLAVTDRFGGWGLAGRFEDESGLTTEPH